MVKRGPRRKRELEYRGQTCHVSIVSELTGIPIDVLWQRWQAGDRGEELVRKVGIRRGVKPADKPKDPAPDVRKILKPDPVFDALLARWRRLVFGECT